MATAPQPFLAFIFTDDSVAAALWQMVGDQAKILARSSYAPLGSLQVVEINAAVDTTLDEIGQDGLTVQSALFCLPPTWLEQGELRADRKRLLKTLTQDLLLKPLGYVITTDAIAVSEKQLHGHTLSSALVLNGQEAVIVAHYNNGELESTRRIGKSGETAQDVAELQAQLANSPHHLFFIDSPIAGDNDELARALEGAAGKSVERIQPEQLIQTVVPVGGQETLRTSSDFQPNEEAAPEVTTPHLPSPAATTHENGDFRPPSFLRPTPHNAMPHNDDQETAEPVADGDEFAALHAPVKKPFTLPKFPKLSLSLPRKLPNKKVGLIAGVALALLAVIGSVFAFATKTEVTYELTLKTTPLSAESTFFLTPPNASAPNATMSALAASFQTESVTLEQETAATGKKLIGDAAKGKVTILNKTQQPKTFPAGTKLVANNLTFILDEEVQVASASSASSISEGIAFGKAEGKVTAAAIGPEGNLPKDREFRIANFDTSTYIATNKDPLAGGSSREILAVAQKDIDGAVRNLGTMATDQLRQRFEGQTQSDAPVLFTGSVKSTDIKTSAEVGEEAQTVKVVATFEGQGAQIQQTDIAKLAESIFSAQLNDQVLLQPETAKLTVSNLKASGSVYIAQGKLEVVALPKMEASQLSEQLAGQYFVRAETILKDHPSIESFTMTLTPPWAKAFSKRVPKETDRIHLNIQLPRLP